MSYLRTATREVRWLFVCAPLFGGIVLNACLSDSTTPADGNGDTTGASGSADTTMGSGAGGADTTGSGGGSATTGSSGSNVTSGAGGSVTSGAGGSGTGTGGSTGGGGSAMTGSTMGMVAEGVRWVGRVDASKPTAVKFDWGGSGFVASVTGTSVTVQLNNDNPTFFQPVVDGTPGTRVKAGQGMSSLPIALGAAGTHTVELYRETEAAQSGVTTLVGITGATLNPAPTYSGRLIETIGDSLSNGYGELGSETHPNSCSTTVNGCNYSIDTQSNYQSYTAVAARALKADWSIVANSGWGLSRDLANGQNNVMGNVYGEAYYVGNGAPMWMFPVKAQAVIINLGTNDTAMGDPGMPYQAAFVKMVGQIRSTHGADAWIFPVTGSMIGGNNTKFLAGYINAGIAALKDPKIFYVDLGTQDACGTAGTGCQWHPSVAEHKRLADLLIPVIKTKLGWQ